MPVENAVKKKLQMLLYHIALFMEIAIGIIIVGALLISVVGLLHEMEILYVNRLEDYAFGEFLAAAFNVVIGIEFLKMLCRHNLSSVIEVLLFAIARGMVVEHMGPVENLCSVFAIAILFMIRKFLFIPGVDSQRDKDEHI